MKHYLCVLVYRNNNEIVREDFEQPDITAEDFDVFKHVGMIASYPLPGRPLINGKGFRVWQYCKPENDEERDKLIEMGKWMSEANYPTNITNQ